MKETWMILMVFLIVFMACKDESGDTDIPPEVPVSGDLDILSEVPEGAQAVSLRGESLFSRDPSEGALAKLEEARKAYEADSESADNLIWYGRRMAYTGDYREAIRIYTEGIRKFPDDARIYRHRGHRYISIREFDRSIEDYEKAATLIEGTEDQIEPDGMPNAQNIPVSSLHTNIWYHLALAYYLNHDLENALRVNRKGIEASTNDDMFVATMHWLYMTLRLMEMDDEAERALEPIHEEMNVIENMVYHRLCLFYKGELALEDLTGEDDSSIMGDAGAYGLGNWHFYNGNRDEARVVWEQILEKGGWASFGYIAAEADLERE